MSAAQTAFFRSSKIHRANKFNNVEQGKLQGTLNLLDKERVHKIRLTNNDIRLISITLDYIQSSSGHSTEGLAPELDSEVEENEDKPPCFLYGERIVSRKVSRFRRAHSALERSRNGRAIELSESSSAVVSVPSTPRPPSTPVGRPRSVSFFNISSKSENKSDDEQSVFSSRPSTAKPAWMDGMSPVTKKLFEAQSGFEVIRGGLHERSFPRMRSHSAIGLQNVTKRLGMIEARRTKSDKDDSTTERKHSLPLAKHAQLSEIMNQRRPTLSANAWRSHLSQNNLLPTSMETYRQNIMDIKLRANDEDRNIVDRKVQRFINKIPNRTRTHDNE